MFRTQRFYVHVELNERRTAQQKAYYAALQTSQADQQRRELFQSIGGSKRTRAMETGGFVPLPYKTASERKKQQFTKNRANSSRKRFVHVPNLVAESVAQSALKQYTGIDWIFDFDLNFSLSENRNETIFSCFEYLTISAYKTVNSQPRSNLQRCLLSMDSHLHSDILKMAVGVSTNSSGVSSDPHYYRVLIAQQQAMDLLIWLLAQWRVKKNRCVPDYSNILTNSLSRKQIESLASSVHDVVPELIHNCFVIAPRTIAKKTCALLTELVDLTQQNFNRLCRQLLSNITSSFSTKRFRSSASLHWLTVLARLIAKV